MWPLSLTAIKSLKEWKTENNFTNLFASNVKPFFLLWIIKNNVSNDEKSSKNGNLRWS